MSPNTAGLREIDLNLDPCGQIQFVSASTVFQSAQECLRRAYECVSRTGRAHLYQRGRYQYRELFFRVGSGIGPLICAPVLFAVFTISSVETSIRR